jgi:hypothetical protein
MATAISIRAPAEIVEELHAALVAAGIDVDSPRSAESAAEAVDAAIGTKQIRTILLLLTLAFHTGSAGVALADKLIDLKQKLTGTQTIELIQPSDGQTVAYIDHNTSDQTVRDLVARTLTP